MAHGNNTIPVPGELRSVASDGRALSADGVYDYNLNKSQETINTEKADKSSTVSNVSYDTTNKKITKTIDGTTSDVVTSEKVVEDGGGMNLVEGYYYNKKFYKEAAHTTEITGADGRIYIDKDTNREFRWDGTKYQLLKSEVDGSFVNEGTFTYRPTAGALDVESGAVGEGGALIECVKGNTIAWNQLVQNPDFSDGTTGWGYGTLDEDGSLKITGVLGYLQTLQSLKNTSTGKFLFRARIKANLVSDAYTQLSFLNAAETTVYYYNISASYSNYIDIAFVTPSIEITKIKVSASDVNNVVNIKWGNLQNLTLIYGEGNEPTTVEQFEADYQKWFGKPLTYEDYDEGSLRSVEMTGIKTVGFNLFDQDTVFAGKSGITKEGEWFVGTPLAFTNIGTIWENTMRYAGQVTVCLEVADITGGESPFVRATYIDGSYSAYFWFQNGKNTFVIGGNKVISRIGIAYGNNGTAFKIKNFNINLSHSGDRNGDYEPYWEHTVSLPVTQLKGKLNGEGESVVIFPDGMKKAGTVYDEIVKRGNQTVAIKRIGQVDLGTLFVWKKYENTYCYFVQRPSDCAPSETGGIAIPNIISNRYDTVDAMTAFSATKAGVSIGVPGIVNGYILLSDPSHPTAPTSQDNWLDGVMLYYELATPQEYIIDDIDFPTEYPVDDYGTEEILANSAKSLAPTLDIRYGLNATDTLRNLPSKYVSAVEEQNFTEAQKERARKNIGADKYKSQIENLQRSVTEIQSNMSYAIDSIVSTFTLEENSSPTFTINNQGAAAQYINHMGGYLFLVKNGKVYAAKRNPSNWGKFADGTAITSAAVDATECMIHVPDCHFLGNNKTLQFGGMTPIEGGHVFGSPHWVGAYQMSTGGHSRAGVGSAHSKTMRAFWNDAQAIHQDMGLANYQFHCLINALYQARYGNLNSESFLSNGNARSSASWDAYRDLAHGMADALGDGTGCVSAVDSANVTRYVTKLFGFEDMFGKIWEFRPGIRFYMDGDVRHAVVYDGNVVSNTAEGRDISGVLASAGGQYTTQMELGEYWDMLPKAVGGGDTTYYCDGYWASTGGQLLIVGSNALNGSPCGLSSALSSYAFSHANVHIGARLAFYSEPEIVSGAELLSML